MPINLPGVPFKLTPEDMGGFDIGKALQQGFNLNKQFQEARTMPKKLAEELLAAQLTNKINKPKAEHAEEITLADLADTRSGTGLKNIQVQKALMDLKRAKEFHNLISSGKNNNQSNSNDNINRPTYADSLRTPKTNGIQDINDFSDNGMPAGSPGISKSSSAYDTFPGRRNAKPNIEEWPTQNQSISSNEPAFAQNLNTEIKKNPKNKEQVLVQGDPNLEHINKLYEENPQFRKEFEANGYKKEQTVKHDPKSGLTTVTTKYPNGKITVKSEGVKTENGKSPLTTSTRSKLQVQKQAIPQLKALIKQLKETPSPFEPQLPLGAGNLYRSSDRANYHSLINTGKDLFVKSKGLNVTDKSLETGEKVLARGTLETDAAYHKRLDDLDKLLDSDNEDINKALNEGVSTKNESKTNNDPLGIR